VQHALFLPPFGDLADPRAMVEVAIAAGEAGWDGLFLWDHVVYRPPVAALADPWIVLAAVAQATRRLRLGTMVTPPPRRRPQVLARQVTSLDQLSGGRVVLGVGIGGDGYGEFSSFGDEEEARTRGAMLDEELGLLRALWSGEQVDHHGEHHTADGVRFLPRPVQRPHPPLWAAARFGYPKPLVRAATLDGVFPIGLQGPDDLRALLAELLPQRADPAAPFDVAVNLLAGTDPDDWEEAGATWCVTHLGPYRIDAADVLRMASAPPPAWPADPGWDA
jgi:alkanesulfonate monooxygenase SsuD/methylene tetrahydromethanopterin reductase-like flavin-dependent oxidoreductase (luciferase family)